MTNYSEMKNTNAIVDRIDRKTLRPTDKEPREALELHKAWLDGQPNGIRADLSNIDLRNANLCNADLSNIDLRNANLCNAYLRYTDLNAADLSNTDLSGADLRYADLRNANLSGADLRYADLRNANLDNADLSGADLRNANLDNADLSGANLNCIKYNYNTTFFALQCPEEGSFIGYKKAKTEYGLPVIVKLQIMEDAKRCSSTSRKCRCNKAKVLSITSTNGELNFDEAISKYDCNFIYKVGEVVEVTNFDENRWDECSTGIHFFITRDEAVNYN